MTHGVLLNGFGFAGFRSFGEEIQRLGPMNKVHLLAGPNNSEKSNILTFAQRILPTLAAEGRPEVAAADYPRGSAGPIEVATTATIGIRIQDPALITELAGNWVSPQQFESLLDQSLGLPGDGLWWFTYVAARNTGGGSINGSSTQRRRTASQRLPRACDRASHRRFRSVDGDERWWSQ